jgi:hypothetical protein
VSDGDWPGEDPAATRVLSLPPAERHVLAALAVVGRGNLSAAELSELTELDDVRPLVDDLERRGLIVRDERRRYSAVERVGAEIRKTDDALATGDQLFGYLTTLAKGGALTPERLAEDAQAILGLTEWAAENEQWARLLELVQTLQAGFGIAERVEEWLTLLERARGAARALGDRHSEVWVLQQLATASTGAGDPAAAQRYLHEADELQRGGRPTELRVERADEAVADSGRVVAGGRGVPRLALWIIGVLGAAGAGLGAGFLVGGNDGGGQTAATVPVTLTVHGQTVTTSNTVTLPATTAVSTSVTLTTETVTTVTTVVTTQIK